MFKKYLFVMLVVGLIGGAALTASAQNNNRLDRQIRKEILTLPYYNVFDAIGYTENNGTVTLNGYVTRPSTKRDAEEEVAEIEGVRRVINNIEVLPPSPSDDRIRQRLLTTMVQRGGSLYRYFMGTNPAIRLVVNRGRVSLEGYVSNKADSNLAYILARGVPGTFAVNNNLQVLKDEDR